MVAPSKRNCRIAQRIARTPKRARGAHIRSSCSRNVTVWQEDSDPNYTLNYEEPVKDKS